MQSVGLVGGRACVSDADNQAQAIGSLIRRSYRTKYTTGDSTPPSPLSMPNGHRQHFRILLEEGWEERDERDGTPSPIHSSDSEDTDVNKYRWVLLAKRVLRRWRIFLTAARRRRAYSYLEGLRLLHDLPSEEVQRVAKYMKHK